MKLLLLLTLLSLSFQPSFSMEDNPNSAMNETWQTFRANHPFGFQTVARRHYGDDCIFVISEPSESVSASAINKLFSQYGGTTTIMKKEFGYDGWLSDVVGQVRFNDEKQEANFTHDLFTLLYGTDYKAFYTDLDNPSRHNYYSPFELNYSVSAGELDTWFVENNELLKDATGKKQNITDWISKPFSESNKLLFSIEDGFVVWLINTKKINEKDESFKVNARKFALDSDLIIGAFGKKQGNVAIVARERQVPVTILPPLRIETLSFLATTDNQNLAQSYERYNVFAGKMKGNKDFAPIYLSDELWHTEYGNLLNVTDQMLKSWSQNGEIDYYEFGYPKPIDWAFHQGALEDLNSSELTYNWNTKGAGYVIQDDSYDIYAINRTGCLPVSYFPDGLEGQMEDKVYDAEELAYDFFSQLNNPELVRVVQYAAFYQILTYFKDRPKTTKSGGQGMATPNYRVFDCYIEDILRKVDNNSDFHESSWYQSGLERFMERYTEANDVSDILDKYFSEDEYGEFKDYLQDNLSLEEYIQLLLGKTDSQVEMEYQKYLDANLDTVRQYINNYKHEHKTFPYAEAAKYIVSPRELSIEINKIEEQKEKASKPFDDLVDKYYSNLRKLDEKSLSLFKSCYQLPMIISDQNLMKLYVGGKDDDDLYDIVYERLKSLSNSLFASLHKEELNALIKEWNSNDAIAEKLVAMKPSVVKKIQVFNDEESRLMSLNVNNNQQQALGALNWLLTDPAPYEEPSGPFFASKLTDHRQWMKTPSMACSYNGTGYGGHNLDAHVTPVKISKKVSQGKCLVSFENGSPIISTSSKADMKKVTRDVLRKAERRTSKTEGGTEINLPDPPKRPKSMLSVPEMRRSERGFDLASSQKPEIISKSMKMGNDNVTSISELFEHNAAHATTDFEPSKEIRIKRYTEVESLVEVDGQQYILDRSQVGTVDLNNLSSTVMEETRGDHSVLILEQKPETINDHRYKAANVELICPKEMAPTLKDAVRKVMDSPSAAPDNTFKIMRDIQLEMQQHMPDFNSGDIRLEEVIFSYIIRMNYYNDTENTLLLYDGAA